MSSSKPEKNYTVTRDDLGHAQAMSQVKVKTGSGRKRRVKDSIRLRWTVVRQDVGDRCRRYVVSKNTLTSSYPPVPRHATNSSWKNVPLAPLLTLNVGDDVLSLVWDDKTTASMVRKYACVAGYELFGHRGEMLLSDTWRKIRYFKAGRLPMKCQLVYRQKDVVHNYAVRAVDVHNRCAPCAVVQVLPLCYRRREHIICF